MVKSLPTKKETLFLSLGQEDSLEDEMSTHSNILAWEIPWTEAPGRLQSVGLQRVKHDLVTKQQHLLLSKSMMPVCNQQIQTEYRLTSKSLI